MTLLRVLLLLVLALKLLTVLRRIRIGRLHITLVLLLLLLERPVDSAWGLLGVPRLVLLRLMHRVLLSLILIRRVTMLLHPAVRTVHWPSAKLGPDEHLKVSKEVDVNYLNLPIRIVLFVVFINARLFRFEEVHVQVFAQLLLVVELLHRNACVFLFLVEDLG